MGLEKVWIKSATHNDSNILYFSSLPCVNVSEVTPASSLHLQVVPPAAATAGQRWCATARTSVRPRSPSSPSPSTTSSPPSRRSPSPSPRCSCPLPLGCRLAAAPPPARAPAPARVEVRLRRTAAKTRPKMPARVTRRPLLSQSDPRLLEATPLSASRGRPAPLPAPPARPALRRRRTATPARCRRGAPGRC